MNTQVTIPQTTSIAVSGVTPNGIGLPPLDSVANMSSANQGASQGDLLQGICCNERSVPLTRPAARVIIEGRGPADLHDPRTASRGRGVLAEADPPLPSTWARRYNQPNFHTKEQTLGKINWNRPINRRPRAR